MSAPKSHLAKVVGDLSREPDRARSTLARLAMAFEKPDAGSVSFLGEDMARIPNDRVYALRAQAADRLPGSVRFAQSAQDGRLECGRALAGRPVAQAFAKARQGFGRQWNGSGCRPIWLTRYPHQVFRRSAPGRVAIARAIVTEPELIVADEPVASLDVSVQAQVLNLFMDLQEELGLAMLFISHDLAVVASLCDRIAVMQTGRIVEQATARDILSAPKNEYTRRAL